MQGQTTYLGLFPTSEEAALAYDDHLRSHAVAGNLVRRLNFPTPLEVRRSLADAPRNSERALRNSEAEALSKQFLEEHVSRSDWELEWMYEGTRADGAFRPATTSAVDDGWVGLQMKAASRPRSGTDAVYHFSRIARIQRASSELHGVRHALVVDNPGGSGERPRSRTQARREVGCAQVLLE